jgi:AraC-like DNA-binding protein
VIDNVVGFDLEERGEDIYFRFTTEHEVFQPPPPCEEDAMWAFITSICRASYGDNLNSVELRLMHQEPACKGDYYGFFRCPVRFDSDVSEILFAKSDVERPLPSGNRELARANDKILMEFLNNLRRDNLITRVKSAIAKDLPSGSPSDDFIAKAVCMTPRTLQRRLAAEGTSFSKLRDAVRRELAEQYIADPSQSLSEISYLLGFSELSAFSRAFRRWTGASPKAYREKTNPSTA